MRRFFLNFPDPFFKRQQHKRRAVNFDLFEALHPLLQTDGEIYVNTDIFDLALESMTALEWEAPRRFANLRGPWSFLAEQSVRREFAAGSAMRDRGDEDLAAGLPEALGGGRHISRQGHLLQLLDAVADGGGLLEFQLLRPGRTSPS